MGNLNPEQGYIFESGKVYSHAVGLSCVFRQWRAKHTHCSYLHGYALKVEFSFRRSNLEFNKAIHELDEYNWVMNFGGLKEVKKYLENTFDHKTLVATDDPLWSLYDQAFQSGLIDMVEVENTGCEAFAKMIFEAVKEMLPKGVQLQEVKVSEHEGNWASYKRNEA